MDKREIGEDTKISLWERFMSLCSKNKIKIKRRVNQDDIAKLLVQLDGSNSGGKIAYLDSRPVPSGNEIDFTSAGRNRNPREMINYIERRFYQSEGTYKIFSDKDRREDLHRIRLIRTNDNSGGSLDMEFYH